MKAVECCGTSFGYTLGNVVLDALDFQVDVGEICGLVGASGSGKSTLLRLLAALLPVSPAQYNSGIINIFGQAPRLARNAGQLGFVFQDMKLLPFLSVRDNLLWAQKRMRLTGAMSVSALDVDETLDLVGLTEQQFAWPKELSGGMKARVALARALITKPRLLLLDEALSSLDVGWRIHLYRELVALRDRLELTIVMISHDLEEIARVADRILVLSSHGRLSATLPRSEEGSERIRLMEELIFSDHPARYSAG